MGQLPKSRRQHLPASDGSLGQVSISDVHSRERRGTIRTEQSARELPEDKATLLAGDQIFQILNNVELPLAKSLGSSRVGAISFTSYFGPNVTEGLASIEKREAELNNIACLGYEDGERVLWGGAKRKGKVWQQRSGSVSDWVDWCRKAPGEGVEHRSCCSEHHPRLPQADPYGQPSSITSRGGAMG